MRIGYDLGVDAEQLGRGEECLEERSGGPKWYLID